VSLAAEVRTLLSNTAHDSAPDYIDALQRIVIMLAGAVDDMQGDLDWHGTVKESHQ
jgi:hypothetical protein